MLMDMHVQIKLKHTRLGPDQISARDLYCELVEQSEVTLQREVVELTQ